MSDTQKHINKVLSHYQLRLRNYLLDPKLLSDGTSSNTFSILFSAGGQKTCQILNTTNINNNIFETWI